MITVQVVAIVVLMIAVITLFLANLTMREQMGTQREYIQNADRLEKLQTEVIDQYRVALNTAEKLVNVQKRLLELRGQGQLSPEHKRELVESALELYNQTQNKEIN
jgi:hypothetical protein